MDELAFHQARLDHRAPPCVFEKAILAGCAQCGLASRRALAERELLACGAPVAHINCTALQALLRERARFALRLPAPGLAMAHASALRLQCGGLAGIQRALGALSADVHSLVQAAQSEGASLADLPWSAIVSDMRAWQTRRRAGPR